MKDILLITKIESRKIYKSRYARIGILAIIIIMLCLIVSQYIDNMEFENNSAYRDEVMSWRDREENLIKFATESLNEDKIFTSIQQEQIKRRIELAEYRLNNNIPRNIYKNVWWFFNDNSFDWMIRAALLILIFVASESIGGEYSQKTLKQILILPYRRSKIILGKILALVLYGLVLYAVLFILGLLSGFIIYGTNGLSQNVLLYFGDSISSMNMSIYSIIIVLIKLVDLIFSISVIVFLCVWLKNSSISAIIAIICTVLSTPIINYMAQYSRWMYYLPFVNLDFRRYLDFGTVMPSVEANFTTPVVSGITPITSALIIGITILVFLSLSISIFKKQDI